MIRNGMGNLPISVHPGTKNKLLVEAVGLKVTTHWESNPLPHDVVLWAHFLFFHYRPAVWHATIATLVKSSLDTLNVQQRHGREKHWHKNLGTEQVGGVGTLCVIFTAEAYNSLIEFTRQTFDYSRCGRTTGREHKLNERFDIGYKYKTTS